MAKKTDRRRSKNIDLPRFVTKSARGIYLYKRRVPKGLAEQLAALGPEPAFLPTKSGPSNIRPIIPASRVWEHSLGSDPAEMAKRARELTAHYDALLPVPVAPLTPSELKAIADERAVLKAAVKLSATNPEERWKQASTVLDAASALPVEQERDTLSLFTALAYGGEGQTPNLGIPVSVSPTGTLLVGAVTPESNVAITIPRPSGADGHMFDAMRTAVETREKEIAPKDTKHPLRLSQLLEPFSRDQGHRKGTADGIRRKVNRFKEFAGDKPLWDYDHETIIRYRDYLRTGDAKHDPVKESTINQYIAALRMVWNASPDRWKEYRDIQFPRVKLRKIKDDVQDTRWKSFTDAQMKDLWREMQRAWGPGAQTRLTPSRRQAFMMAVRVMLYTGLRPVEVWHLTSQSIVGDTIHIKYTKTHHRRTLPLSKHLADLPAFLASGGFQRELEAAATETYKGSERGKASAPETLSKSLRKYFAEVRTAAGITDEKLVLYSLKDTLVRRLQMVFKAKVIPITYDVIRDIIGHKTKGALAHYVTLTGDTDEGLELIREALDSIEYW